MKERNVSRILTGLIFLAVGVLLIGKIFDFWDFNIFFNGWWTLFLIIPAIVGIINDGLKASNVGLLLLGAALFAATNDYITWNVFGKMVLPVILILVGLDIIFGNMSSSKVRKMTVSSDAPFDKAREAIFRTANDCTGDRVSENRHITAMFGTYIHDMSLERTEKDVMVETTAIFGTVIVTVPNGANVKINNSGIFGGVQNNMNRNVERTGNTIYFNSTSIFGKTIIREAR